MADQTRDTSLSWDKEGELVRDTASAPDTERGVYRKYDVKRLNDPEGKHDKCPFYVLDVKHDVHARTALEAYAMSCESDYPKLAEELRRWVVKADGLGTSKPNHADVPPRFGRLADLIAGLVRKALDHG